MSDDKGGSMSDDFPVKITYDDDTLDTIAKLNRALKPFGLRIEDDELPHDGYVLVRIGKATQ